MKLRVQRKRWRMHHTQAVLKKSRVRSGRKEERFHGCFRTEAVHHMSENMVPCLAYSTYTQCVYANSVHAALHTILIPPLPNVSLIHPVNSTLNSILHKFNSIRMAGIYIGHSVFCLGTVCCSTKYSNWCKVKTTLVCSIMIICTYIVYANHASESNIIEGKYILYIYYPILMLPSLLLCLLSLVCCLVLLVYRLLCSLI